MAEYFNRHARKMAQNDRSEHVLKIVLAINTVLFYIEFGGELLAHSTTLLADSLDMCGDAMVYGVSLYVLQNGKQYPYHVGKNERIGHRGAA